MTLCQITAAEYDVVADVAYATSANIANQPLYAYAELYLIDVAARALAKASELARIQDLKLRIFDAYRPRRVQEHFWQLHQDKRYVADPETGSTHTRGIAVDLTLQTNTGAPLDMGCDFDNFDNRSHVGNTDIAVSAQMNRYILTGIMIAAGWACHPYEWWHFNLPDPESYPLIDGGEVADRLTAEWLKEVS